MWWWGGVGEGLGGGGAWAEDFFEELGFCGGGDGVGGGEDEEEETAEGMDIGFLVDGVGVGFGLFWGGVRGEWGDGEGDGGLDGGVLGIGEGDNFGEVPVIDEDLTEATDRDDFGADFPMDDAAGVSVGDGIGDFLPDDEEGGEGGRSGGGGGGWGVDGIDELGEGEAFDDAGGGEEGLLGGRGEIEIEDGEDAWVLELGGDVGFADEVEDGGGVGLGDGEEDFHGDRAIEGAVVGFVDRAGGALDDEIAGEIAWGGEEIVGEILEDGGGDAAILEREGDRAEEDLAFESERGGAAGGDPVDRGAVGAGEIFEEDFAMVADGEVGMESGDRGMIDDDFVSGEVTDAIEAWFDDASGESVGGEIGVDEDGFHEGEISGFR